MQRSNRIILAVAAALGILSIVVYFLSQDTPAPRLTRGVVQKLLADVAVAVHHRDASAAFACTTPDAILFGQRRARLERWAQRWTRQASTGTLEITWRDLTVTDLGSTGLADFYVVVGERLGGVNTVYFESQVTLHLTKTKLAGPLGLGSKEKWLISRAEAVTDPFSGQ